MRRYLAKIGDRCQWHRRTIPVNTHYLFVVQRDRLIRLLDRSADPAFAMTERGEIWSWNRAAEELFGYSASEAIHQQFSRLVQPHGRLGMLIDEEYCRLAVRSGQVPSFDMQVKHRAGRRVWVNVSVLVFEALNSAPPVIVHLAHDITLARRREALARRLTEAARRLLTSTDEAPRQFAPVSPLSSQEQRIIRALALGNNPGEIARDLGISSQTLRNHLHHINQKLGTHTRLEAVTHAIRRKLI